MKAAHLSWTKSLWNFRSIQEHKLRGTSEFIRYHAEIDIVPSSGDSENITDWLDSSFTGDMFTFSRRSDHVDQSSVRVCSDSVLSLVKMSDHSEAHRRWEYQLKKIQQFNSYSELFEIGGEPIEFQWNVFPGRLARSKHWTWNVWRSNHLHVNVQWHRTDKEKKFRKLFFKSRKSRITRRGSREDTGHSSAWGRQEMVWNSQLYTWRKMEFHSHSDGGAFQKTGHPVIKSISALSRGILTRKNDINTIHFNADATNTEFLCRTIHSANQFSIYGAVSSWCEEFGLRPNERESWFRKGSWQKKMSSYWKEWNRKK